VDRIESTGDRIETVVNRIESTGDRIETVVDRIESTGDRIETIVDRIGSTVDRNDLAEKGARPLASGLDLQMTEGQMGPSTQQILRPPIYLLKAELHAPGWAAARQARPLTSQRSPMDRRRAKGRPAASGRRLLPSPNSS